MGIEPTMPLLAQSIIGFEDRGRHQSGTRFHRGNYTELVATPTPVTAVAMCLAPAMRYRC